MTTYKFRIAATAIALVCFTGLVTSSEAKFTVERDKVATVPQLDVQPSCRATASVDLDLADKPTFQSCIDAEQAGRQSLEKEWSTYAANDRRFCTTSTQAGGPPSYVNLLWCLRDADAARKLEGKPTTLGALSQ
jgi:hypothetical protein